MTSSSFRPRSNAASTIRLIALKPQAAILLTRSASAAPKRSAAWAIFRRERHGSVRDVFRELDERVADLDERLHDCVEHGGRRVLDGVDQLGDRLSDRAERSNDARDDAGGEARRLLEQLPHGAAELEERPHHVLQQGRRPPGMPG